MMASSNLLVPEPKRARYKNTENAPQPSSSVQIFNKMRRNTMDAYSQHKVLINNYLIFHKGSREKLFQRDTSKDKNDYDIIRENHRFLWSDRDVAEAEKSWDASLAKRYYDRLYKEYCIADLSQYKKNLYAMRWRVEKEVFSGKGQFECGNKHCANREELSSWEVNFAYVEQGERKNALVKLRLCPKCSEKLNYHSKRKLIEKKIKKEKSSDQKGKRKESRERKKAKRKHKEEGTSSSEDEKSGDQEAPSEKKERLEPTGKTMESQQSNSSSEIWKGKSSLLVDAEKTLNDELDEFIDDLLL